MSFEGRDLMEISDLDRLSPQSVWLWVSASTPTCSQRKPLWWWLGKPLESSPLYSSVFSKGRYSSGCWKINMCTNPATKLLSYNLPHLQNMLDIGDTEWVGVSSQSKIRSMRRNPYWTLFVQPQTRDTIAQISRVKLNTTDLKKKMFCYTQPLVMTSLGWLSAYSLFLIVFYFISLQTQYHNVPGCNWHNPLRW